jgi:hypothetical protein
LRVGTAHAAHQGVYSLMRTSEVRLRGQSGHPAEIAE